MKQLTKSILILTGPVRSLRNHVRYVTGSRRLKRLRNVSPLRLVIGASGVYDSGWINTDIEYLNLLDPLQWETYFNENSIDAMLAEHVWEHLTIEQGMEAARRCFQYLKPGGYLRVAVPDGCHPSQDYIAWVKPGGTGPAADDHRVLYNHTTFADVFVRAGFRVELLEYFDSQGEFHYVDWSPEEGKIRRSSRFDERNSGGTLEYTSLILDAHKDA
ncbi:MAG: methyltransferase domain-containing protein [Gemmatimonadota bacterium]|nr:MAG: methyltransferase domain-containing protein [Gemmatimonadota bacterium]